MESKLITGIIGQQETIVTKEKTASAYGSGLVDVFATPAMIAFMEQTAHLSVGPYLEAADITVGTLVNVTHVKATPVGMKVYCKTELTQINGRELIFSVMASDEQGEIGRGIHHRFIVNRDKFMQKLSGK